MANKNSAKSFMERATATAKKSVKGVTKSLENAVSKTEKLRDQLERRAGETADQTRRRAARLSLSVLDFQKTTFDNAFKAISRLQEQSENAVSKVVTSSDWTPAEGKAIVKEWVTLLRGARADFQKTVDKSFDLITDYFERVETAKPTVKKAASKAAPKKKAAAKKKKAAPKKAKKTATQAD